MSTEVDMCPKTAEMPVKGRPFQENYLSIKCVSSFYFYGYIRFNIKYIEHWMSNAISI